MDNANLNAKIFTNGKIEIKIEFEPSVPTSDDCENINYENIKIKEEFDLGTESLHESDNFHTATLKSSDSEASLKLKNEAIDNNFEECLLKAEDQTQAHKKGFICDICHKTYTTKDGIRRHIAGNHGSIKCIFCPCTFNSYALQQKHIRSNHAEKQIECSIGYKKYCSNRLLRTHMDIDENEKLSKLRFTSKNIPAYECGICQRKYHNSFIFKRHKLSHKYKKSRKSKHKTYLKCPLCNESFTHMSYFLSHQRVHDEDTQTFECDICKNKFARRSSLVHHVQGHNNERKYTCKLCPKNYKFQKSLKRHMHTHNEIQTKQGFKFKCVINSLGKFECEICKKMLSSRSALKRHLLVHAGVKDHSCQFCGEEFFRKTDLNVHIRIHTGEKPYSCSKCEEQFTHIGSKRKHEKNFH